MVRRISWYITLVVIFSAVSWATGITSASSEWTPLLGTSGSYVDYSNDSGSARRDLDLLGSTSSSALLMDYAGDGTLSGGTLSFRVRLGVNPYSPYSFTGMLLVGIDGDQNGTLDLFVGVDGRTTSTTGVHIWEMSSSKTNYGPTSSGFNPTPVVESVGTYNYSAMNVIDRAATNYDLDSDGQIDRLLSFSVSFSDIVAVFQQNGITVTKDSLLRFSVLTSEGATFNDIAGMYGNGCSGSWATCNTLTKAYAASYTPPPPPPPPTNFLPSADVTDSPEPGTIGLLGAGLAVVCWRAWRVKKNQQPST